MYRKLIVVAYSLYVTLYFELGKIASEFPQEKPIIRPIQIKKKKLSVKLFEVLKLN